MTHSFRTSEGYIALMAVLIAGAASVAIGLALLAAGTDSQRSTLVSQQSAQARALTTACAEEALQQINDDTTFLGGNSLTISPGSCTYVVNTTGASTRIIDVSSVVNTVVNKAQIYVTINQTSITVTSWQEVTT